MLGKIRTPYSCNRYHRYRSIFGVLLLLVRAFYMNLKYVVVSVSLAIAFIISITIFYLVIYKIPAAADQRLYELYEIYVVSGFAAICLIVVAVLRYALSKRHCS